MKVMEIMEKASIKQTGRAIMYIKEALQEMALKHETHIRTSRIDIQSGKRFYQLPNEAVKILDIRCKNHNNSDNDYRSVPRSIYEPTTKDSDGI